MSAPQYDILRKARRSGMVVQMSELHETHEEFLDVHQPLLSRLHTKVGAIATSYPSHYAAFVFVGGEPLAIQTETPLDSDEPGTAATEQLWRRKEHLASVMAVRSLTSQLSVYRYGRLKRLGAISPTTPVEAYRVEPETADMYHSRFSLDSIRFDLQLTRVMGESSASLAQLKVATPQIADITALLDYDQRIVSVTSRQATSGDRALLRRFASLFKSGGETPTAVLKLLTQPMLREDDIERLLDEAMSHILPDHLEHAALFRHELREHVLARLDAEAMTVQFQTFLPTAEKLSAVEQTVDALLSGE